MTHRTSSAAQPGRSQRRLLLVAALALALTAALAGLFGLSRWQAARLVPSPTTWALPNDANWFCSPGNWYVNGSQYARTNNPGAYCKFRFHGTGLDLAVDLDVFKATSPSREKYPSLKWKIDAGPFTERQLTSSTTSVPLAQELALGDHSVEVYFESIRHNIDRWKTPSASLDFTAVTVTGGTLITPTLRSQRWLAFGDSRTEGINASGSSYSSADQAAAGTWVIQVGEAMDAEIGAVGWVSQGWNHPSTPVSNVGAFHNGADGTWSELWHGQARSFDGIDAVLVNHGFNDAASTDAELEGHQECHTR